MPPCALGEWSFHSHSSPPLRSGLECHPVPLASGRFTPTRALRCAPASNATLCPWRVVVSLPLEPSAALRPRMPPCALGEWSFHSHSMVPGGLLVTSRTTRLKPSTSFVIRVETRASTSYGGRAPPAVRASSLTTGRRTTGCP